MDDPKPDEFKEIKVLEIKITTDTSYFDEFYGITDTIADKIRDATYWGESGTKKDIKRIKKLIKKYPHIPQFKNHLSVAYMRSGKDEQAYKLNEKIRKEHPEYCYAFLNECNMLLYQERYEKLEKLLGPHMDISAQFPEREYFHPDEVCSFYSICARFKYTMKDFNNGDEYLSIVKQIDPNGNHVKQIETEKMRAMMFTSRNN